MFVPALPPLPLNERGAQLILMSNLTMILNYEQLPLLTDVLYHQDGVVARKKNPVFPLVVVAAGIGLSIWSLNAPALEDSKNLSASLMLVGGVVALLGLIRLVMAFTGKKPVYGPTGETLTRKELFFEAQDRQALLAAFQAGDMEKIERIPHGHSSNVLLMIYTTPSGSCTLAQVQEYVPHEFVAVTDVARFSQAAVKEPQTAAKNVAVSA